MKWVVALYLGLGGKSPDSGARFIVTAALRKSEDHVRKPVFLGTYRD